MSKNISNHSIPTFDNTYEISRREFLKLGLFTSGALSLSLAGCSPSAEKKPLELIDEWIAAMNAGDEKTFTNLHTENVFATRYNRRDPYSGSDLVYGLYEIQTKNAIEKVVSFYQDETVCLVVNAIETEKSLCYVFNIVDERIAKVYEYDSGKYYLGDFSEDSGLEVILEHDGLSERLKSFEIIFIDGLNNRDFSVEGIGENAVFYGPADLEPYIGKDVIGQDGADYATQFPDVRHSLIKVFGQGNLACLHLVAEGVPKGSLCFVAAFQDQMIARLYEFWSDARVGI